MFTFLSSPSNLPDAESGPREPALLLAGSWPQAWAGPGRSSLDDDLPAGLTWIDRRAADYADQLAPEPWFDESATIGQFAWFIGPRLRYQLVRWLRLIAFCESSAELARHDTWRGWLDPARHADEAQLLTLLATARGVNLQLAWSAPRAAGTNPLPRASSRPSRVRRWLSGCNRLTRPRLEDLPADATRVLLAGQPRVLDPVAAELQRRRCSTWWLYDQLAVRAWLTWRRQGIGQWTCDEPAVDSPARFVVPEQLPPLRVAEIDLAPLVQAWLETERQVQEPTWRHWQGQLEHACRQIRPSSVALDHDAGPFQRLLVATARRLNIPSVVVQHGAPYIRFGFAPLAADVCCAWGEPSRRRFLAWGMPQERIVVTGAPAYDGWLDRPPRVAQRRGSTFRCLVLATTPPRDDRPEPLAYRQTTRSYLRQFDWICGLLAERPGSSLCVRPHPRDRAARLIVDTLRRYPRLNARIDSRGSLVEALRNIDCVISCASSGGVEAALLGVPVVQLLPPGAEELLPARDWGWVGTARSRTELAALVDRIRWDPPALPVSDALHSSRNSTQSAAAQVVELLIARGREASDQTTNARPARPIEVAA